LSLKPAVRVDARLADSGVTALMGAAQKDAHKVVALLIHAGT
jgi:hypothetical protein